MMESNEKVIQNKRMRILDKIKNDCRFVLPPTVILLIYFGIFCILDRPICPLRAFFGIPCPGCGMTRAMLLLLQGRFVESFFMHPFIYIWIIFLAVFLFVRLFTNVKLNIFRNIAVGIGCLMFVFFVYRMITLFPNVEPLSFYEHATLMPIYRILHLIN